MSAQFDFSTLPKLRIPLLVISPRRVLADVKPWAPSFSYGLVIELSEALAPIGSAHSRANGRRHAILDVLVWNGALLAASKASGELLNLGCARDPA